MFLLSNTPPFEIRKESFLSLLIALYKLPLDNKQILEKRLLYLKMYKCHDYYRYSDNNKADEIKKKNSFHKMTT